MLDVNSLSPSPSLDIPHELEALIEKDHKETEGCTVYVNPKEFTFKHINVRGYPFNEFLF